MINRKTSQKKRRINIVFLTRNKDKMITQFLYLPALENMEFSLHCGLLAALMCLSELVSYQSNLSCRSF